MSTLRTTPVETGEQKRRTERILLKMPIEVSGATVEGNAFKEKTHTLAINRHGARVALRASIQAGTTVRVTNLQNMMTLSFRAVGRLDKSLSGAPEWGVECLEVGKNFWGIFFPEKTPGPAKGELIDVLLECSRCRTRELKGLTLEDYQKIITEPSLSRPCDACQVSTPWTFGVVVADRGSSRPAGVGHRPDANGYADKRMSPRVPVSLPVRIRLEEIGRTENLSKGGVCFSSSLALKIGDRIRLTVGFTPGGNEREVSARVVWRQGLAGGARALYGVELTEGS